jgi:hypothetical protein
MPAVDARLRRVQERDQRPISVGDAPATQDMHPAEQEARRRSVNVLVGCAGEQFDNRPLDLAGVEGGDRNLG